MSPQPPAASPLICHIVYRFDVGGLENGLVNLINRLPASEFRHVIVALTDSTSFASRIERRDVATISLHKQPGKSLGHLWRLFRLLQVLRPAVVHTRNLAALECQLVAWCAGVECRVHSEHGWDVIDPKGETARYVRLRRLMDRFVGHYVALSREIESWLVNGIGVDSNRVTRICNGVDVERFRPSLDRNRDELAPIVVGTVTRLQEIKDPINVVEAFYRLRMSVAHDQKLELVIVGDGPLMAEVRKRIDELGIAQITRLVGNQSDVLPWLQRMDIFVLGSRREGISNTILEAMACGLPVVATCAGGNSELVDCETGSLTPVGDADALATAISEYVVNAARRRSAAVAGRRRAESRFALQGMVDAYADVYRTETRRVS